MSFLSEYQPDTPFPSFTLPVVGGESVTIGSGSDDGRWQLAVFHRGNHCQLCRDYLTSMEDVSPIAEKLKLDLIAISNDGEAVALEACKSFNFSFAYAYGVGDEIMERLGLIVNDPNPKGEPDWSFPEPCLFVIGNDGLTRLVDFSHQPFIRPTLDRILMRIAEMRDIDVTW